MNAVIVDTDVVSMTFKRDSRAALYETHLIGSLLGISFMTRAELSLWPRASGWGEHKITALERFLQDYVVLPYDEVLCEFWAEIKFASQRKGRAWYWSTTFVYSPIAATDGKPTPSRKDAKEAKSAKAKTRPGVGVGVPVWC